MHTPFSWKAAASRRLPPKPHTVLPRTDGRGLAAVDQVGAGDRRPGTLAGTGADRGPGTGPLVGTGADRGTVRDCGAADPACPMTSEVTKNMAVSYSEWVFRYGKVKYDGHVVLLLYIDNHVGSWERDSDFV